MYATKIRKYATKITESMQRRNSQPFTEIMQRKIRKYATKYRNYKQHSSKLSSKKDDKVKLIF